MATKNEMRRFEVLIGQIVVNENINYMDAIVHHCRKTGMEIETASSLVNSNLKKLIATDAVKLHMIKPRKKKNVY